MLDSLAQMPDEFLLDELLERLVFVQKVEDGLQQSERGEIMPIEAVRQRLHK